MTRIRGVLGSVELTDDDIVLPHEHCFVNLHRERYAEGLLHDYRLMVQEVQAARDAGVRAIVDCTPPGIGRNDDLLLRLARELDVVVVAGCGYYRDPYLDDDQLERHTPAELAELLIGELTAPAGQGLTPGVIGEVGCALDFISPREERALRASAIAAVATGIPVTTHVAKWPVGQRVLDILHSEGLDPSRVIVGHVDTVPDDDYAVSLAARGAYVQLDNIRTSNPYQLRSRLDLIRRLLDAGHADKILLSQDVCLRQHLSVNGGPGYTFVVETFVPYLVSSGIDERIVRAFITTNPQQALAVRPAERAL